jgi:hypothetical protein
MMTTTTAASEPERIDSRTKLVCQCLFAHSGIWFHHQTKPCRTGPERPYRWIGLATYRQTTTDSKYHLPPSSRVVVTRHFPLRALPATPKPASQKWTPCRRALPMLAVCWPRATRRPWPMLQRSLYAVGDGIGCCRRCRSFVPTDGGLLLLPRPTGVVLLVASIHSPSFYRWFFDTAWMRRLRSSRRAGTAAHYVGTLHIVRMAEVVVSTTTSCWASRQTAGRMGPFFLRWRRGKIWKHV